MRGRVAVLLAMAAAGVLVGCSSGSGGSAGGVATQTGSIGEPETTTPATTPPVSTTRAAVPPAVTRDGPCPYFGVSFAQETIGQHLARSTVTTTRPYPGCTLYRPDGGKAIEIRISALATPLAAQQRAVTVLGAGANPTDIGDRGTVAVGTDGTRLAASKGRYLLVVYINQQSSLQAHDMAAAVAAKIH